MKNRNKGQIPEEYIDIEAKAAPIEVDVPIIVHATLHTSDGSDLCVNDPDAAMMSAQFPTERVLTVYHNGAPEVTTVKQLVEEVLLSIKGEVKE